MTNDLTDLHIVELRAENVKKIKAVRIRPDGALVQITGANGQGKTSVLDAILWALDGAGAIQAQPVRKGETEARIQLDLGPIKVRRTFRTEDGKEYTTHLIVEGADGAQFRSPQTMLDQLYDKLTLDPLAFATMTARQQFDALRAFVPGFDFDTHENLQRGAFATRTDVSRQLRDAIASARTISVPDDTPDAPVDEAALAQQLADAGGKNADIERRRARREAAEAAVKQYRTQAQQLRDQAAAADAEAEKLERQLAEAGALPAPVDLGAIQAQLGEARRINANVQLKANRAGFLARAEGYQKSVQELTDTMAQREKDKAAAIAAVKLPVEGLSFGDGLILMNGVPFEQASDAERLRVSCAIAMASSKGIKVLRIRRGQDLDEKGIALVAAMAEASGWQVWMERVSADETIGVHMEDGMVHGAPVPEPMAQAPTSKAGVAAPSEAAKSDTAAKPRRRTVSAGPDLLGEG